MTISQNGSASRAGAEEPDLDPSQALHLAVEAGDLAAIERALSEGADVNSRDTRRKTEGRTPLINALVAGQVAAADLLLDKGADPKLRDSEKKQRPPYPLECVRPQDLASEPFRRFMTPLMVAATLDQPSMIQRLAPMSDLDVKDASRHTALMMAAANGHGETTKVLLEVGASPAVKGPDGETALTLAIGDGHVDCVRALLEAGGDPNSESDGEALLHQAVILANDELVNVLLDAGADPSACNHDGKNALEYARDLPRGMGRLERRTMKRLEQMLSAAPTQTEETPTNEKPEPESEPQLPELSADLAERYARDTVLQRLQRAATGAHVSDAVAELSETCGSPAREHLSEVGGHRLHVRSDRTLDITQVQDQMLVHGCFVFVSAGLSRPEELTVLPTLDPLDAVAAIAPDGANYDIETEHILAWLQHEMTQRQFAIVGLRHDLVALRYAGDLGDVDQLAHSMYAICPDVVDQGTGTVEDLVEQLKESGKVTLWWD